MRQSVRFPAIAIMGIQDADRLNSLAQLLTEYESAGDDEKRQEILKKAEQFTTSEEIDSLVKTLGVQSYLDFLNVYLDLGSFLFDVYVSNTKEPEAPIAKFAFHKKMQDLSKTLKEQDLSADQLDEEFRKTVVQALSDDEKWKALQVFAYVEKDQKSVHFPINTQAIYLFDKVINRALEVLNVELYAEGKAEAKIQAR